MLRLSDLPDQLEAFLKTQWGFDPNASVSIAIVHPAIGDKPHDAQFSLAISSKEKSGFVLVGPNQVVFRARNETLLQSITTRAFARLASQIDPQNEAQGTWPASVQTVKNKNALLINRALTRDKRRVPYEQVGLVYDVLDDFASLPVGHPAKDFITFKLAHLHKNKRLPIDDLKAMKSVKTFYEAGKQTWAAFPNLHAKKEINILYPGGGENTAALATAMGLIDEGAEGVHLTMTELKKEKAWDAFTLLPHWLHTNPFFSSGDIDNKWATVSIFNRAYNKSLPGNEPDSQDAIESLSPWEMVFAVPNREPNGSRYEVSFTYKGKPIRLTYAINDSPDHLYFHPQDAKDADAVIIHDIFSGTNSDTEWLTAHLQYLLPSDDSKNKQPKALILPNEFDRNPQMRDRHYGHRHSILPVQGIRVTGGFGHSGHYGSHGATATQDTPDMGLVYQKSALIVSTGHPLMKTLHEEGDIKKFVAFSLLAGGAVLENPREPQEKDYITIRRDPRLPGESSWYPDEGCFERRHMPTQNGKIQTSLNELLSWAGTTLDKLPAKEKEYLALVSARLILFYLIDQKIIDTKKHSQCANGLIPPEVNPNLIPENLKQAMVNTLLRHKLIHRKNLTELFAASATRLKALDKVVMKLQDVR